MASNVVITGDSDKTQAPVTSKVAKGTQVQIEGVVYGSGTPSTLTRVYVSDLVAVGYPSAVVARPKSKA